MPEVALQGHVQTLARDLGWRYFHPADNRPTGPRQVTQRIVAGYPDLTMLNVRQNRLIVAELKAQKGRLSDAQRDWLADFTALGIETFVWRPSDLIDGTIASVLGGGRRG